MVLINVRSWYIVSRHYIPNPRSGKGKVNEIVKVFPSTHLSSCCFSGKLGKSFYPLNVVMELGEKQMVYTMIEHGAFEIAEGAFIDTRNHERYNMQHSLDSLFRYCDAEHRNMLKDNLKRQNRWSEDLEAKYPYLNDRIDSLQ